LILCGSTAGWPQRFACCQQLGVEIVELLGEPPASVRAGSPIGTKLRGDVAQRVTTLLKEHRIALLTIGRKHHRNSTPQMLVKALVTTASEVVTLCGTVASILIEGGETASAVARELDWTRLQVVCAIDPGITALRPAGVDGLTVLVKPGSYPWPAALCRLLVRSDGDVSSRV
jgi:hypothetical protein